MPDKFATPSATDASPPKTLEEGKAAIKAGVRGNRGLPWWQRVMTSGPVAGILDTVSRPAYMVGDLIAGKPGAALAEIAPFSPALWLADKKHDFLPQRERILPGTALTDRGLLPKHGVLGGITRFTADVALDPTTYLTFGVGGVAKRSAQAAASGMIESAARSGAKIDHALVAKAHAVAAAEYAKAPKAFEAGIKVPFRRGPKGTITVVSSPSLGEGMRSAAGRVGQTAIGKASQDLFRPGGRANPVVKAVWGAVENVSRRDKSMLDDQLKALNKESLALEKQLGLGRGKLAEALSRHFDDPAFNHVPKGAEEFARKVDDIRQGLQETALKAGLLHEDELLANHISHLPANRATAVKFEQRYGKRNPDNPYFQKHRAPELRTLADWEKSGLAPELNVFRLLQARGHAAIDAIGSRTAKDTLVETFGVAGQRRLVPDVGGAAMELDAAVAELQRLSGKAATLPEVKTAITDAREGTALSLRRAYEAIDQVGLRRQGYQTARVKKVAARGSTRVVRDAARNQGRIEGRAVAGRVGQNRSIVAKAKEVQRLTDKLKRAEAKAAQAVAHNKKLAQSPGRFVDPREWQKIQQDFVKLGEETRGYVPREVAESLDIVMNRMGRTMTGPSAVFEAGQFINRIGSNWKSLAILSPGFHMRNMVDDGLRGFFAGARNPVSYAQAAKIVTGKGEVRLKIGGATMSGKQIEAEAEALGVTDRSIIGYEIQKQSDITSKRRFAPSRPGEGTATNVSRKIGTARENAMRLGTYIDLRKQGYSALEAAERVATHHFDYGDVSLAVAKARRFWLPFVTYSSKAVPYFARQVVQNPGQAAAISKGLQRLQLESGETIDPSLLPVGQRLAIPLPFGGKKDNQLLLNPEGVAYFTALNQYDPTQVQRQFVAKMVNPLVRSPVEYGTEHSFYRGRALPQTVRAPNWMASLANAGVSLPGYVPPTAERPYRDVLTKKATPGVSGRLDTLYRNLPIYSQSDLVTGGAAKDWQLGLTKYFFGAPVQRFDRLRAQQLTDYFQRRDSTR